VVASLREAHELERPLGLLIGLFTGVAGDEQSEAHVLGHGLSRQQLEVLEHDADPAAKLRHRGAAHAHDVLTIDQDAPRARQLLTDQKADEAGLPGARRTDEEDEIA
jgi:hypothetical protein